MKRNWTPEPWTMDKAKWGACQWGAWEDKERGEPNLVGGVLDVILHVPCKSNDDHDWTVRSRRADQQDRTINEDERYSNAARIVACVNACAGLDDPANELASLRAALAAAEAECAEWRRNSGYVDTDGLWHVATHVPAYAVAEAANANDATRARLGLGRIGEAR